MEFSYYPVIFGAGVLGIDFGLVLFMNIDSSLCPLTWLGGIWSPIGILSPDYLGINGMASLFLIINRQYTHNCFVINDRIYGRVFYIGTGLHGSHVLIGVFFLVINFFRVKFHNFNWYHTQAYDISIDYWRFLE
ncbi:unnamed protein product [Brugia pahangi]|uniref:Cytochrome c oxidase subunit 3 n=1 Tax=Brugia pahangi TaxID=6280 RepID=A0A0N4TG20_BRUPA|nr:unnamed protein product [Brugia pahangi]